MKTYIAYKKWWIDTQAQYYYNSPYYNKHDTPEELFTQHIENLGLYGLMETLCNWDED